MLEKLKLKRRAFYAKNSSRIKKMCNAYYHANKSESVLPAQTKYRKNEQRKRETKESGHAG